MVTRFRIYFIACTNVSSSIRGTLHKPATINDPTTIIVMAVAQALLQLIMFMHLKEGEGRVQILTMIYSFFVATATVGLTVWIFFSM